MKTRTVVTTLLAMAVAASTLAQVSAKSKDDEKKAATATPRVPDEYRMNAGDKLRIEVYKDAQLSQSAQVRPDGKVTLPLIGDLMASGLTPIELRDQIATKLKEYVTNPTVTVIVVETVPATAYVMGEVNHPGAVNLQAPLTIIQALAVAGGLKDFADEKNIRVLRKESASVKTINFNYREAVKSNSAPFYLQAGDTVIVPD